MFLEKNEQKDRKRRQAYRVNLRERKWEAAERIAMVEEDVDANGPLKKRKLSTQVMEVAQKNEATAVKTLSDTLPGTPVELQHHQQVSDDEKPQKSHVDDASCKKHGTASTGQQQLHLTPWFLQQYHLNQPTDENIPPGLIERKDAKYRWASYSRIAPQLHSHVRSPQGQWLLRRLEFSWLTLFESGELCIFHLNRVSPVSPVHDSVTSMWATAWIYQLEVGFLENACFLNRLVLTIFLLSIDLLLPFPHEIQF